jgi:cell fate regulator YaaT (PSP1 superfamily)
MTDAHHEPAPLDLLLMNQEQGEATIFYSYKIRFREFGPERTATSHLADIRKGEQVMVRAEQGPEPAVVVGRVPAIVDAFVNRPADGYRIQGRANSEQQEKYLLLPSQEQEAFRICRHQIDLLGLTMQLVRVERFFNGSKIIFYFTAENRVDFRELVKVLVQQFRTRVEMRQIGVRHETQMIGGLGACGRELCCSSFLNVFDSVSIKMAKTQDLSLNPAKISGVCNRLLCCLTYEYETYRTMKKGMPRLGRQFQFEGKTYQVNRLIPLLGKVAAFCPGEGERIFTENEWRSIGPVPKSTVRKGQSHKDEGGSRWTNIDIWGIQNYPEVEDDDE